MTTQKQNPWRVGDELELTAERLNDDGDGVGYGEGIAVFSPGLLPGETAIVRITQVDKRFARARIIHSHTVGASRQQPDCAVFGACGGCQLQHMNYASQLEHKRNIIEQTLIRHAKLPDVRVLPTLGMDQPWRYRNQVQVVVEFDSQTRRFGSGFFAPASHDLVSTDTCHLEPSAMERTVSQIMTELNAAADSGIRLPLLHHLIVRESATTHELMVILAVRESIPAQASWLQAISGLPGVISVAQTVQNNPHGPVWGATVELLYGASHLREQMDGLEFLISPRSFFQVNTEQAAKLYERVVDYAQPSSSDVVLDAYCGTGTMTLLLAKHAKRVLGIESVRAAVEDARLNAEHNHIRNTDFLVGEVERVLPKQLAKGEQVDVVVLDPPRRGCHPDVLTAVVSAQPKRIVYVSCNHATLARDLRALVDGGYEVLEAQPVDMFPQTSHVECVVRMERKL